MFYGVEEETGAGSGLGSMMKLYYLYDSWFVVCMFRSTIVGVKLRQERKAFVFV